MKDYAKEAIHNVENTRLISILKALALAIQADVNSTLTPEQCRTIVREMDYLRQEGALLKRAEAAEARVAELEAEHNDALETVEKLGRELGKLRTDYDLCYERLIEMEAASRWIPVSERLPEEMQNVLVISRDGYVYNWRQANAFMQFFVTRYTHWRPFEPPQEVER